jgi:mannose-6-phosphate isomerase-like protein (cupin superfamily)
VTAGKSLYDFPIHLGRGARAVEEPQFTGPEWYESYGERHADDMDEGRIVSLFRFEEPWTSWEMHPVGDEVVCCLQGQMVLHQELPEGTKQSHELGPGEYAINPAGAWHTADTDGPVVALFITAGKDTTHKPR